MLPFLIIAHIDFRTPGNFWKVHADVFPFLSFIYVLCACVRVFEELGLRRRCCLSSLSRKAWCHFFWCPPLITLADRSLSFAQCGPRFLFNTISFLHCPLIIYLSFSFQALPDHLFQDSTLPVSSNHKAECGTACWKHFHGLLLLVASSPATSFPAS